MLCAFVTIHERYHKGDFADRTIFVPINWVRVWLLLLKFCEVHYGTNAITLTPSIVNRWNDLWPLAIKAGKKFASEASDSQKLRDLANEGLAMLDDMGFGKASASKGTKGEKKFPESIILALQELALEREEVGPRLSLAVPAYSESENLD